MGSSNPVKKAKDATSDFIGSVKDDPMGALVSAGTFGQGTALVSGSVQAGTRIRDDQRDQAAGMAESEQNRVQAAERAAVNASVKDLDPIALERRRRAAVATNNGRSGTILTSGTTLGSADVGRKVLLGL